MSRLINGRTKLVAALAATATLAISSLEGCDKGGSGIALNVVEGISVSDLPQIVSGAVLNVAESIAVTDSAQALLSPLRTTPLPPKLVSPGSSSSPGPTLSSLTPIFTWNAVPGADNYGLHIFDIATKSIVFNSQANGSQIKGTAYTLSTGVLQWRKSYYWYMNSHNSAGWGSNSVPLYFQTQTPR